MIAPALTASEWHECKVADSGDYNSAPMIYVPAQEILKAAIPQIHRPHAMAALCLYGQPFGFTREDLSTLDWLIMDKDIPGRTFVGDIPLQSLRDRIAALLPPDA